MPSMLRSLAPRSGSRRVRRRSAASDRTGHSPTPSTPPATARRPPRGPGNVAHRRPRAGRPIDLRLSDALRALAGRDEAGIAKVERSGDPRIDEIRQVLAGHDLDHAARAHPSTCCIPKSCPARTSTAARRASSPFRRWSGPRPSAGRRARSSALASCRTPHRSARRCAATDPGRSSSAWPICARRRQCDWQIRADLRNRGGNQ